MKQRNFQSGQSLIETIVAIFILVSALSAGLGMAIFALNASDSDERTIIAMNLAREGLDVARMMRDSNWLATGAASGPQSCSDLGGQACYPAAFSGPTYDLHLSNGGTNNNQWRFRFNSATRTWSQDASPGASRNFLLCLQNDGTYQHNDPGGSGIPCAASNWARRIVLTVRQGTAFGYSSSDLDNAEVIVQSIVQWSGKRCAALTTNLTPNTTAGPCKVIVEERLTNWKDYR